MCASVCSFTFGQRRGIGHWYNSGIQTVVIKPAKNKTQNKRLRRRGLGLLLLRYRYDKHPTVCNLLNKTSIKCCYLLLKFLFFMFIAAGEYKVVCNNFFSWWAAFARLVSFPWFFMLTDYRVEEKEQNI